MFTVIYNTFLLSNNRFNTRRRPSFNASQNSYNKSAILKTTEGNFFGIFTHGSFTNSLLIIILHLSHLVVNSALNLNTSDKLFNVTSGSLTSFLNKCR